MVEFVSVIELKRIQCTVFMIGRYLKTKYFIVTHSSNSWSKVTHNANEKELHGIANQDTFNLQN